jgi:hypothetical protein
LLEVEGVVRLLLLLLLLLLEVEGAVRLLPLLLLLLDLQPVLRQPAVGCKSVLLLHLPPPLLPLPLSLGAALKLRRPAAASHSSCCCWYY